MSAFPSSRDSDDDLRQLAEIYRRHTPAEPSPEQWQRVHQNLEGRALPRPRHPWVWLALGAALLLIVAGGLTLWMSAGSDGRQAPLLPPEESGTEPFAVASAAEITIHGVEAADADRIAVGRLLLGKLEFARAGEIEVVETYPDPAEGWMPTIAPNATMPLIVALGQEP
jgi:hypothetical protein